MGKRKHIVKQRMQMRQPARPKRVEPIQAKQTFADIVEVGSNLISPIPIEDGNIGKHQKHASLLQSLPIHSIKEESMRKLKDLEVGNDDENKYDDDDENELVQWDYNQHSDNELFVDEGNDNNEENIG